MTRDHLIEDIRNVLEMAQSPVDAAQAQRIRNAFRGLHRHVQGESDVPERVESCLAESIRFLEQAGTQVGEDTWDYARACLQSALEFAVESGPEQTPAIPSA